MAPQKARLRYHCVEIIAGPGGCKAAVELKKMRLLSADAPRLPLATCEYSRAVRLPLPSTTTTVGPDPRRGAETGTGVRPWTQTNRRKARGRREADFE